MCVFMHGYVCVCVCVCVCVYTHIYMLFGGKAMTNLDSILKSRNITLPTKVDLVKGTVFPVMYRRQLDYKESWVLKNWRFWTVVLEKTLESPSDCKEIQLVKCKGNQSWIFTGSPDAEAETPTFWLPDSKNWFIGKGPGAGKYWRREKKGTIENEMVGWHHRLSGHEFEQAPRVGDRQGSLACISPWGCKESDMTEQLNWTELIYVDFGTLENHD